MPFSVQDRPGLQVTHPIQHPWVSPAGRMSFPSLDHWTPGHSRLASVVQEAYAALTGQPLRSPVSSPQRPGMPAAAPSPRLSSLSALENQAKQHVSASSRALQSCLCKLPQPSTGWPFPVAQISAADVYVAWNSTLPFTWGIDMS